MLRRRRSPSPAAIQLFTVSSSTSTISGSSSSSRSLTTLTKSSNSQAATSAPKPPWSGVARYILSQIPRALPLDGSKGSANASSIGLVDLVKKSIGLSPATMRRFWRASMLQPADMLQVLQGFGADVSDPKKVQFLWELFDWASKQSGGFRHLPQSYEILVSLLLRARMSCQAETLLLEMERNDMVSPVSGSAIYSEIIQIYLCASDWEKAISLYCRAAARGIAPTVPCYRSLLGFLVETEEAQMFCRVYMDMVNHGLAADDHFLEIYIRILCRNKRVLEGASIFRRVISAGMEPNLVALNLIAEGFCDERDFENLSIFLKEWGHPPSTSVCNKIVSAVCSTFGAKKASQFSSDMENLGFVPDSMTFEILIRWSCKEKNMRDAFMHLSELLFRNLKPGVEAYNALISGLFKEGMLKYTKEVFNEVIEEGLVHDMSTFRVMLAGYCRENKFDQARLILTEMVNRRMISLGPSEDAISKTFTLLGLDCLGVKLKRANGAGFQKAEVFDSLGNRLYLDTDIDDYEKILMEILDDAIDPDLNNTIIDECQKGNTEMALVMKHKLFQKGKKLSFCAYSTLLECLLTSTSNSLVNECIDLFEGMPEFYDQLDQRILNLLIQTLSKNRIMSKAKLVLNILFRTNASVENESYESLVMGYYKINNIKGFQDCWNLARSNGWLPTIKDFRIFLVCLCKYRMLEEVIVLFEDMLDEYPHYLSLICNTVLTVLCFEGFRSTGCTLVKEVLKWSRKLNEGIYVRTARGFCLQEKVTEAAGVFEGFRSRQIDFSVCVYKQLVPLLLHPGETENAIASTQLLLANYTEVPLSVHNVLLNELCKKGYVKEITLQLHNTMVDGLRTEPDALNVMIEGYSKVNSLRKTCELLCILLRTGGELSISSYRSLIRLNCEQNRLIVAMNLKRLFTRKSEVQTTALHNILIFYLFQTENSSFIEVVLNEMHENSVYLDEMTFNFLIYGQWKCGNVSRSVDALYDMVNKELRPSRRSLRIVISYLCHNSNLNKASELMNFMNFRGIQYNSTAQYVLIENHLLQGKFDEAELLLSLLEDNVYFHYDRFHENLIKRVCEYGEISRAIAMLNSMLNQGNNPSESSYESIIRGLLVRKEFNQALDFYIEMQHRNLEPSWKISNELLHALCVNGRTDDARKLLEEMLHLGQVIPSRIISSMMDRFYAKNNIKEASDFLQKYQLNGHLLDFRTHWSLISNLNDAGNNDLGNDRGLLPHLMS